MEVRKFVKKTLQILANVATCIILLALPASSVFIAIGSSVGSIVTLSLALGCEAMGVIVMVILLWEEASEASHEEYREEASGASYRKEDVNENIVSESG